MRYQRLALCVGTAEPRGRDAVGWRVGVYWRDDHAFYPGIVDDVHRPTGRHIILYDDGAARARVRGLPRTLPLDSLASVMWMAGMTCHTISHSSVAACARVFRDHLEPTIQNTCLPNSSWPVTPAKPDHAYTGGVFRASDCCYIETFPGLLHHLKSIAASSMSSPARRRARGDHTGQGEGALGSAARGCRERRGERGRERERLRERGAAAAARAAAWAPPQAAPARRRCA